LTQSNPFQYQLLPLSRMTLEWHRGSLSWRCQISHDVPVICSPISNLELPIGRCEIAKKSFRPADCTSAELVTEGQVNWEQNFTAKGQPESVQGVAIKGRSSSWPGIARTVSPWDQCEDPCVAHLLVFWIWISRMGF
jgi:hypothetical protein